MKSNGETLRVLRRHINNVRAWDLAALAGDYAEDAAVLFPHGAVRGRDAIIEMFRSAAPVTGLTIEAENAEGTSAMIVYRAEGISFASDSFVIEGGLIRSQTIAVHASAPARQD